MLVTFIVCSYEYIRITRVSVTWNVRSLYRAGRLVTITKEISKYKIDLVGVPGGQPITVAARSEARTDFAYSSR
jgi:hypothetical protein